MTTRSIVSTGETNLFVQQTFIQVQSNPSVLFWGRYNWEIAVFFKSPSDLWNSELGFGRMAGSTLFLRIQLCYETQVNDLFVGDQNSLLFRFKHLSFWSPRRKNSCPSMATTTFLGPFSWSQGHLDGLFWSWRHMSLLLTKWWCEWVPKIPILALVYTIQSDCNCSGHLSSACSYLLLPSCHCQWDLHK